MRRQYLVNPKLQKNIIYLSFIVSFVVALIIVLAMMYTFMQFEKTGETLGLSERHTYFEFLQIQKKVLIGTFLIVVPLALIVSTGIGLMFSHRIAGPMYKLKMHLDQLTESGEIKEIKFREGDYFTEVADAFNSFIQKIKNQNQN